MKWIKVEDRFPPKGKVVHTKIDDDRGVRNETKLKLGVNNLWFMPDDKMYVYYTPTHWAEIEGPDDDV